MRYLTLSVPDYGQIKAPGGIPTGGLEPGGTGQKILQTGIELFFIAAVVIALIVMIFSGIQWITSGGDKQKLASARNRLVFAIIGLVVVFLAFFIIGVIGYVFKVPLLGGLGQ